MSFSAFFNFYSPTTFYSHLHSHSYACAQQATSLKDQLQKDIDEHKKELLTAKHTTASVSKVCYQTLLVTLLAKEEIVLSSLGCLFPVDYSLLSFKQSGSRIGGQKQE